MALAKPGKDTGVKKESIVGPWLQLRGFLSSNRSVRFSRDSCQQAKTCDVGWAEPKDLERRSAPKIIAKPQGPYSTDVNAPPPTFPLVPCDDESLFLFFFSLVFLWVWYSSNIAMPPFSYFTTKSALFHQFFVNRFSS